MKRSNLIFGILLAVVGLAFLYGVWLWLFCRFYVPPDHMAIITAKVGEPLPPGQILAKPGQKGVLEEPLGEGRHFRNPVLYDWSIVPVVDIPVGKVGVVTSKVGEELPPGEFLAEPGQKGIWRKVLGPGKYRLNPIGYDVEIIDALTIPIGYVGVVTSLAGKETPGGKFAGPGEKGVRRDVLQPGLYYVNPKEFKVDVVEIGLNQVSLAHRGGGRVLGKQVQAAANEAINQLTAAVLARQRAKRVEYLKKSAKRLRLAPAPQQSEQGPQITLQQARGRNVPQQALPTPSQIPATAMFVPEPVEFPSRDGFLIQLDMTVEFEFVPEHMAEIFRSFGDLPAVVDKIILPQILSVSRMKGSMYGARDFIIGEGREKFQNDLKKTLSEILGERNIMIHNALVRHVVVPPEILEPIQEAALAIEQDLTNKQKQETAKIQAELNTQESLIEQRRAEVQQETERIVAETMAEKDKEVAKILADADRQVAEIEKQTAEIQAEITRMTGEAEARIVQMVEGEKAKGYAMRVAAVGGPLPFTTVEFAEKLELPGGLSIIHAGEGTLWTDLRGARLGDLAGGVLLQRSAGSPKSTGRAAATKPSELRPSRGSPPVPTVQPRSASVSQGQKSATQGGAP